MLRIKSAHWIFIACVSLGGALTQKAMASPLGDAIRQISSNAEVQRSLALSDLGITEPVVLAGTANHDFYFPVPYGLPLLDANVAFDGRYLKGVPGTASFVLSTNGVPASSMEVPDGEGGLQRSLPVTQISRASNFVRLGVDWRMHAGEQRCDDSFLQANSITISPKTRLNYRVDVSGLQTIDDVLGALPAQVTILIANKKVDQASFDSAWRIGAALLRSGKRIKVRAIPAIGDLVDTKNLNVPAALAGHPEFAALKSGDATQKITTDAQIGALILLGAEQIGGDIVLLDKAMQQQVSTALDALQTQLEGDADASEALKQWRAKQLPLTADAMPSKGIRVASMGRQRVLAVAADAGAQFAGLQEAGLQKLLVSPSVTVPTAQPVQWDESKGIRLTSLGGAESSFDVVSKGDWTANFPLSAVASQGGIPSELTLYVAAAPGASSTKPVASVFWNGVLLSAKQLDANGKPEQLIARIPSYALGVNNNLRVSVQRQPYSADCNELPQAYPVSVFPSISYVTPGKAHPDGTFVGLLPLLGAQAQLLVPENYLAEAPANLERIAGIAAASGVSASQTELLISKADAVNKPSKPFLSMDVALGDVKPQLSVAGGKRLQIRGKELSWLDISGLSNLSSVEVVKSNGQHGILWHAIGDANSDGFTSFLLNRGNIAVLGNKGPVAWIDGSNPNEGISPNVRQTPFYEWRNFLSWSVPGVVIAVLLLVWVLWMAWRVARKNQGKA